MKIYNKDTQLVVDGQKEDSLYITKNKDWLIVFPNVKNFNIFNWGVVICGKTISQKLAALFYIIKFIFTP